MIPKEIHRNIYFIILPTVQLLDLTGPVQAFDEARQLGANYTLHYVGLTRTVMSAQGMEISNLKHYSEIKTNEYDIVFFSGISQSLLNRVDLKAFGEGFYLWIKECFQNKTHLCTVCNSTFVLAESGILDGKKCATHWKRSLQLQELYPDLKVIENCLFIHGKQVSTSAGSSAGIDLSLALIDDDYGPIFTSRVAKELVLYLRRTGQEKQLSFYLDYRNHTNLMVHKIQDYLIQHPSERKTIDELAEMVHMSGRHLSRLFKSVIGITLHEFVQKLRIEIAQELYKSKNYSLKEISEKCGFENPRQFRRLWNQYSNV